MTRTIKYTNRQTLALVTLRVLIGWHFLYEGISKLLEANWSAAGYLNASQGPFSSFFKSLTESPDILNIVDLLNIWGLILIGSSLIAGLFTKAAISFGIILLLFYYLAIPPFPGLTYTQSVEGSYLIVNKNLIEISALFVLLIFPTGSIIGLDRLIFKNKKR